MSAHKFLAALVLVSFAGTQNLHAGALSGLTRDLNETPSVKYIQVRKRTMAPFAHVMFCARQPQECEAKGGAAVVALSTYADKQLRAVNASVNRSIVPRNDASGKVSDDVWEVNVKSGDCEDFALTKRDHLIAMGWSSKALRIAVARTPYGEGHAVLVVKTNVGDLVLDNRTNAIKTWDKTDLNWVMIQSADDPRVWYEL
ncbi:putative transglutaminase-like cysteine proteinase [Rhizobium sp. BK529]|uniref:transglutaminase-like cysteine peptidase n=1 Tax=unclassified Rhizobium TaxID=2613769 RepID=UPI00104A1043|nr:MULTISPECIES: transglutaminase-like cysteine peptidase [unclassified Rhizobium]MBB3595728.1 putative transglutaminase-like cysteine proteinase [Rhizobium sp. BK529]TCR98280.1 putative transglutaminase-like cysteine proteinase [Rhizobium sp. BK418]